MINRKVKFTILNIDNKIKIDNITKEFEENIFASKHHAKEYHDKRHHPKNISLQVSDRVMAVKQIN